MTSRNISHFLSGHVQSFTRKGGRLAEVSGEKMVKLIQNKISTNSTTKRTKPKNKKKTDGIPRKSPIKPSPDRDHKSPRKYLRKPSPKKDRDWREDDHWNAKFVILLYYAYTNTISFAHLVTPYLWLLIFARCV